MIIQIFCDFDGTITNNDNIMSIMEKFAPPEAEEVKNKILSQKAIYSRRCFSIISIHTYQSARMKLFNFC